MGEARFRAVRRRATPAFGRLTVVAASIFAIPAPFRSPLLLLARLDAEHAEALRVAIESLEPFRRVADLRAAVEQSLPEEDAVGAIRLVSALLSLTTQFKELEPEGIAEAVSASPDLTLSAEERQRLGNRLRTLVQSTAVVTTAKAVDLLTEHQRNYQTARVLTDLRPVFGPNVEDPPAGAVIVEMLQLQTWDHQGDSETLYVAMDEADLLELQGVVERALKKTSTLKQQLARQGMYYYELDKRGE